MSKDQQADPRNSQSPKTTRDLDDGFDAVLTRLGRLTSAEELEISAMIRGVESSHASGSGRARRTLRGLRLVGTHDDERVRSPQDFVDQLETPDRETFGRSAERGVSQWVVTSLRKVTDSFGRWLRNYVVRTGAGGPIEVGSGLIALVALLGALLTGAPFKIVWAGAAMLAILGLLSVLISRFTELRHRIDRYQNLLTHYCDLTYDRSDRLWRIDRWDERVTISGNGDAAGSIVVHALVESDELHFFRLRIGAGWPQPEKYRRRVRVVTTSIEVDGAGGTRWDQTLNWLSDGRLEVLAHFMSAPPKKGDELVLRVEFEWPGKAVPLMRHHAPDEFVICMGKPLAYLRYQVELPLDTQVRYDLLGLKGGGTDSFTLSRTAGERAAICLVAHDIEADRRIGMRLDMK